MLRRHRHGKDGIDPVQHPPFVPRRVFDSSLRRNQRQGRATRIDRERNCERRIHRHGVWQTDVGLRVSTGNSSSCECYAWPSTLIGCIDHAVADVRRRRCFRAFGHG